MKAVAPEAIFMVGAIAIFLFFIIATFFGWAETTGTVTTFASCNAKKIGYCSEWTAKKNEPGWWGSKEPLDCERSDIKISKPICNDCKKISPTLKC